MEITVGKPLGDNPIPEGIMFDFSDAGGFLRIAYNNPSRKEIEEIHGGKIYMGIIGVKEVIFLLFKFGDLDWMDAPYNVNLSREYTLDGIIDETIGYLVTTVLLDSRDNVVKNIRAFAMPFEMSTWFKVYVEMQRGKSVIEYHKNVSMLYNMFTTDKLVDLALSVGQVYDITGPIGEK